MKIFVIYDEVAEKPVISFISDNDKTALRDFGKWLEKVQEQDDFTLWGYDYDKSVASCFVEVDTADCKKMAVERMEKAKEEFLSRVRADAQSKANHSQME